MKGYTAIVKHKEGDLFNMANTTTCVRCGEEIDCNSINTCMMFGNLLTKLKEHKEAMVRWNYLCTNCSKELSKFFNTDLYFRGKIRG